VAITSADMNALTVVGGGVTIPAGQTSAPVLVNGLAQSANVALTATLGSVMLNANVRVVGATEQPAIASLTPAMATAAPGASVGFTVTLDIPAPAGGSTVSLALAPANAGTIPATVTVPANQTTATFNYVDASAVMSATLTATLGSSMKSATITISAGSANGLVINEVDYDNVGTDSAEFVEIYNGGTAPINLTGYNLVLINGANNTAYKTVDLGQAGTLMPGQYLVIGSNAALANASSGALTISFGAGTDYVQNGSPDGLAIVNSTTNTLVDALSYEGAMTMAQIPGLGTVSLVEGTALATSVADSNTAQGSLCRMPNGQDTNNASADWKFCTTLTPGAPNMP
jgi:hypothetical protein